ncbi:MAG: energy transducer TonB [Betaproteobacteria bacterium]
MVTQALELPHSRIALGVVVAAHVVVTWAAFHLLERAHAFEPKPITVSLLEAHAEIVPDVAPVPLPAAPPKPKPIKKEPIPLPDPPPVVEQKQPDLPPISEPPTPAPPVVAEPAPELPVARQPAPQAITPPASVAVAPPPPPPLPPPVADSAPLFNADYLRNPSPAYPALSRRLGEEGLVLLRVNVTPRGEAKEVDLKAGCGHPRLDRAAQEAVKQWKFVPAKRGDQPVEAWVVVPIRFSLKG